MKKLALTLAIVLGLGMTTFANSNDGGLFQRGTSESAPTAGLFSNRDFPGLPGHGSEGNEPAPLGSGVAVLLGLGAAYFVAKKRKED